MTIENNVVVLNDKELETLRQANRVLNNISTAVDGENTLPYHSVLHDLFIFVDEIVCMADEYKYY